MKVETNYMLQSVGKICSFMVINGKIIILRIDVRVSPAGHKEQIEVNKLKFITSATFYITKAKQTIIATL